MGKTALLPLSYMAILQPEVAAMQKSSWKAITVIWKRMVTRATTACQISGAVPAGHTFVGTLVMPLPKGNSMITAFHELFCMASGSI